MFLNRSNKVIKPWGSYSDIIRNDHVVIKDIFVNPNQRLSLQYHKNRSEMWTVSEGSGIAEINGIQYILNKNDMIYIPLLAVHRVYNNTTNDMLIIREVQIGENGNCCCEDDIIRLEDDYERK